MGKSILPIIAVIFSLLGCSKSDEPAARDNWEDIKNTQRPFLAIPAEYSEPFRQKLANYGWEDGLCISRDGLDLYALYTPGDLLSWTLQSANPTEFAPYLKGPLFNMDLTTNPVGASSWLQSDIIYSHRNSTSEDFPDWNLSNMASGLFSEGAPLPFEKQGNLINKFIYTSNEKVPTYDVDIWSISNSPLNPSGTKQPLPNFPHTEYTEDNPHLERINGDTLILFFDSDNYPNRRGSQDIWYSTSNNNGETWSPATNNLNLNTSDKEHQPHLYQNKAGEWYLYFAGTKAQGKLEIFRAKQTEKNNWNSWGTKELVIGAGTTAGVGEPTLTDAGDISFVVIIENNKGTNFDRFDSDPWYLKRK